MPIVQVSVWEGFGPERSKIIIHHVTKIFEELNVPRDAVEVIIHEVPKSHWGVGGVPASDR